MRELLRIVLAGHEGEREQVLGGGGVEVGGGVVEAEADGGGFGGDGEGVGEEDVGGLRGGERVEDAEVAAAREDGGEGGRGLEGYDGGELDGACARGGEEGGCRGARGFLERSVDAGGSFNNFVKKSRSA